MVKIPRATSECDTIATCSAISTGRFRGIGPGFCPTRAWRALLLVGHISYPPPMVRLVKSLPQHPPVSDIQARNRLTPLKLIFEPVIPKLNHKLHLLPTLFFPQGTAKVHVRENLQACTFKLHTGC